MSEKAARNKTIDTSISDGLVYIDRCSCVNAPQISINGLLDKTIWGDMFAVAPRVLP